MAKEKLIFHGDAASVLRAYDKIEEKNRKLATDLRGARDAAKGMKGQHVAAGKEGSSSLLSLAAGWVSVGAAIGLAKRAIGSFMEMQRQAAEGLKTSEEAMGRLVTVSGGKQAEMARMTAAVRASRMEEGMSKLDAAELQFVLESTGFQKERATFASLYKLVKPGPMALSVSRLHKAMGAAEVGTPRQALAKTLAAAWKADVFPEELGEAAAAAAASVKRLGASDEQFLAALATASAQVGPQQAGTGIGRFADVMVKKGFQGDLTAALRLVQQKKIPKAKLQQWLGGNVRATKGLEIMAASMPEIEKTAAYLTQVHEDVGTERDLVTGFVRVRERDKTLGLTRRARIEAERALVKKEEKEGGPELTRQEQTSLLEHRGLLMHQDPLRASLLMVAEKLTGCSDILDRAATDMLSGQPSGVAE